MSSAAPPESREVARNITIALLYKSTGGELEASAEKTGRVFARIFATIKASKVRTDYHAWMADLTIALISTTKGTGDIDKDTDKAIRVFELMGNVLDNPPAHLPKQQ